MDVRTLSAPDSPDTPAWKAIADLFARRAELTAAVDRVDREERTAYEARDRAAAALADLERLSYTPSPPTGAQRKSAETELARARASASEPWAERRTGARAALADVDREIGRLVVERFDDLAEGLTAQGAEAAQAVDDAAGAVLSAIERRERIASQMSALASVLGPVRPGDISRSRAEPLAAAASALLDEGERPPTMRDPRLPRHSQPAPEEVIA